MQTSAAGMAVSIHAPVRERLKEAFGLDDETMFQFTLP